MSSLRSRAHELLLRVVTIVTAGLAGSALTYVTAPMIGRRSWFLIGGGFLLNALMGAVMLRPAAEDVERVERNVIVARFPLPPRGRPAIFIPEIRRFGAGEPPIGELGRRCLRCAGTFANMETISLGAFARFWSRKG